MKEKDNTNLGTQPALDPKQISGESMPSHPLQEDENFINHGQNSSEVFLSLAAASKKTGYHQDYLGQVARSGKLEAKKIGRNWVTTQKALNKFLGREQEEKKSEAVKTDNVILEKTVPTVEAQKVVSQVKPVSEKISVKIFKDNPEAGFNLQQNLIKNFSVKPKSRFGSEEKNIASRFFRAWSDQKSELVESHNELSKVAQEVADLKNNHQENIVRQSFLAAKLKSLEKARAKVTPEYSKMLALLLLAASFMVASAAGFYYSNEKLFNFSDLLTTSNLNDKKVAGDSTSSLYLWPPVFSPIPTPAPTPTPAPAPTPSIPRTVTVQGPKGDQGPVGPQGPQGPQGLTGPQGPAGQGNVTYILPSSPNNNEVGSIAGFTYLSAKEFNTEDLIVSDGVTFSALDCTGNTNGGALTADANGVVSCSDDDGGAGGGDEISVNSSAAVNANLLDVAATGSETGTTWTLTGASTPDDITLAISNASATTAGAITTGAQTVAGAKTFTSDLIINKTEAGIVFDTVTATDTDFWAGVVDDSEGDDDDSFIIGYGSTVGGGTYLVEIGFAGSLSVYHTPEDSAGGGTALDVVSGGDVGVVFTNGYGIRLQNDNNGADYTNYYGLHIDGLSDFGQSITTVYGVYIDNMAVATTQYAFYQAGSTDSNYFAGRLGIGPDTTPDNFLEVEQTAALTIDMVSFVSSGATTTNGIDGLSVAFTQGNDADGSDVNAGINVTITGNSVGDSDYLYGLNIANLGGAGDTTTITRAISVGNAWDANLFFEDTTTRIQVSNGGNITFEDDAGNDILSITDGVSGDGSVILPDDSIGVAEVNDTGDAPADEECLTYESTGSQFQWETCGGGSVDQTAAYTWTGLHSWTSTLTATSSVQDINLTLGNDADVDTVSALNIDVTSAATGDVDIIYGLNIANLTSANATVLESALNIGTGWDKAINMAMSGTSQAIVIDAATIDRTGNSTSGLIDITVETFDLLATDGIINLDVTVREDAAAGQTTAQNLELTVESDTDPAGSDFIYGSYNTIINNDADSWVYGSQYDISGVGSLAGALYSVAFSDDGDADDFVAILSLGLTNNSGDAGDIVNGIELSTNDGAGVIDALFLISNGDSTAASVTDAIIISTTANLGITDAIDVSDANLNNALNIGTNTIVGTTGVIDLTDFDVDADGKTILAPDTLGDALSIVFGGAADLQGIVIDAATNDSTQTAGMIQITADTTTNNSILGTAVSGTIRDTGSDVTSVGHSVVMTIDSDASQNHIAVGLQIVIDSDDATSTAYGLYVDADNDGGGSGTEYAAVFMDGTVGIGTLTPSGAFLVVAATDAQNAVLININTEESTNTQTVWSIESDTTNNSQVADTTKAHINADGAFFVSLTGTATSHALCHANNGSTNNDEIVDCTGTPAGDYAEMYPMAEGITYGDVVAVGQNNLTTTDGQRIKQLVKATPETIRAVGVVVNNYGDFTSAGYNIKEIDNPMPVALVGRIPVKVTEENGPIMAGDSLTISKVLPGHAAKMVESGQSLGIALEDSSAGTDTVLMFVNMTYNKIQVAFDSESEALVMEQDINMSGREIFSVKAIASINGKWAIAEDGTLTATRVVANEIETGKLKIAGAATSTVGRSKILSGQSEAMIVNENVEEKSTILITFRGDYVGRYWIDSQVEGEFKIKLSSPPSEDVLFDYWIVGTDQEMPEEEQPSPEIISNTDPPEIVEPGEEQEVEPEIIPQGPDETEQEEVTEENQGDSLESETP